MGESFLEYMKRIGIFIVCAQSFMHFAAGKSYEKYIRLLIGVMILGQFIVPVRALFLGGDSAELWEEIAYFQQEMEDAAAEAAGYQVMPEEDGEAAVAELETEIQGRIAEVAAEYGYAVSSVRVEEEPPAIAVTVENGKEAGNEIHIEKIKIGSGGERNSSGEVPYGEKNDGMESNGEKDGDMQAIENENLPEEMKLAFGRVLGIDASYINVGKEQD